MCQKDSAEVAFVVESLSFCVVSSVRLLTSPPSFEKLALSFRSRKDHHHAELKEN